MLIGGSSVTADERLEYAIKELHTGHLMVLCQFGSMPPELARQNTELFAKEVAPHVRPLYNSAEDCWWPQSLLLRRHRLTGRRGSKPPPERHIYQAPFHIRYEAGPSVCRAALIGGVVWVPSLLVVLFSTFRDRALT